MARPTRAAVTDVGHEDGEMPTLVASDKWLGPYRLCLMLATGGMANVYLARTGAVGRGRFVAIKQLRPHYAGDPTFVAMFVDEAQIASQLQHPNVCSVYDCSVNEGECWLAMEYLNGEPLTHVRRALSRNRKLRSSSSAFVARLVADACEGLHAAHELRAPSGEPLCVVHRDVSLDNLFLTYDGVVKVVDFGIATARAQTHRTQTGVLKGKFAYMQPEVLNGERPDRRADVWGLGVVMWELLTGRRLFHRNTDVETLRAVMDLEIPRPSAVRKEISPELDEIVMRALSRDPKARHPTARDLGRDLTRFLANHKRAVGLAELSEWMDLLFPGGREGKRQVLEIAARLDEVTDAEDSSHGGKSDGTADSIAAVQANVSPPMPSSLTKRHWPLLSATLVVVLLAGLAIAWRSAPATQTSTSPPGAEARHVVECAPPPEAPPSREVVSNHELTPIELGSGTHVLEIAAGQKQLGPIVVRVRPEAAKARTPARKQRMAAVRPLPKTELSPQPLEMESLQATVP